MRCASGGEQTPDAIVALMAGRAISGAAVHPASVGPAGDAVCASPAGAIARAVWQRACRGQRSPRAPRNQFRCTPRIRPVATVAARRRSAVACPPLPETVRCPQRLVAGDEQALRDAYREFSPAVLGLATRVIANESIAEEVAARGVRPALGTARAVRPHPRTPPRLPARHDPQPCGRAGPLRRVAAAPARARPARSAARASGGEPRAPARRQGCQCGDSIGAGRAPRESQRVPIEMAYFEGMSYRQVAAALDEPEGTVKYRIRGGMQKLRTALRSAEVGP